MSVDAIEDLATHPAKYVSTEALARYWGLSMRTIQHYIATERLPAKRIGQRLYKVKTLDALEFELSDPGWRKPA